MGINSAMYNGVSGLNAYATGLTVTSDNIANASSTGFKSTTARFGDMVSSYYVTHAKDTDRQGAGVSVSGVATNFAEGTISGTGAWSDMALDGNGFFNVQTSTGQVEYTRDGSFYMDKNGYLVNKQGLQVLGSDGNPIQVETTPATPAYTDYTVDSTGQIYGTPIAGGDPVAIGNPLRVTTFPNQDGLIRAGNNLFTSGSESGAAVNGTAGDGTCGTIQGSALEGSNVDLAAEMVNMITYQADYNANSKTITTSKDMIDTAVNLIR